jgi:exodeoxyribonuclease-3
MKIATYNVNSLRRRLPVVLDWLEKEKPDVLCLQETKVQDSEFPLMALLPSGYEITYRGMKSYNGVAVLTRTKPESVRAGLDDGGEPDEPRLLHVVVNGIAIINTYIPQGFEIGSRKYAYKLEWLKRLRAYFEKHLSPSLPAIWCGDMNVAPRAVDVHGRMGILRRFRETLSGATAVHLLGLPGSEFAGRQQRLAHRSHVGDRIPGG